MGPKQSRNKFTSVYSILYEYYGPQGWWPAESDIEMIIGAVLTQNTNWKNVDKALVQMRKQDLIDFGRLASCEVDELAVAIRPSGYYNLKAQRLKNLVSMICELYDGDLELFLGTLPEQTRADLLAVKGVGPETADSILLYAGNWPVFVVDAYTHRVFNRHLLVEEETDYHSIQTVFHDHLDEEVELFKEYHALIVRVAKDFCKKTTPLCEDCPLRGFNM